MDEDERICLCVALLVGLLLRGAILFDLQTHTAKASGVVLLGSALSRRVCLATPGSPEAGVAPFYPRHGA